MFVPSPSWARNAKYDADCLTMGHYDVGTPQSFSAVITNAPTLAFKNMTLAQLKAKLESGYSLIGQTIGSTMGSGRLLGQFYNAQYYPSSGTPTKVAGDFATLDGNNVKGVSVLFTESDGDVYAEFLRKAHTSKSNGLSYKFVTLDSSTGNITYNGSSIETTCPTAWGESGYGVAAVQRVRFLPSASSVLVFEGATLASLADVLFTASIGGTAATAGFRCVESARTAGASAIDVTLAETNGTRTVTVRLTEDEDGVYGQAVSAANGLTSLALAESFASDGLCVWGLTALEPAYETAARTAYAAATQNTVPSGSSILVWSGATLDDIKDCWLSCNFTTSMSYSGIEGRGCNRKITYDAEGAASKIRVQFQVRDKKSSDWLKYVIVDMTNGVDGVYATKVLANHVSGSSYTVGYSASESSGSDNYMVYNLKATPCVTLEVDEDWTGHSSIACGDAVIDLNGKSLSVRGIECTNIATGKVVNTKTATTATLTIDVPSGTTYVNQNIDIGYSSAGYSTSLSYSSLATENIAVVKEGEGTYTVSALSEYTGGTEVAAGTVKPASSDSTGAHVENRVFGATDGVVRVGSGATLDWNGTWYFKDRTGFTLNGGAIVNTLGDRAANHTFMNALAVEADSALGATNTWGLVAPSYAALGVDLGGNELAIDIESGKSFYLCNTVFTEGSVVARGAGTLIVTSNGSAGMAASNATVRIACPFAANKASVVSNLTVAAAAGASDMGTAEVKVLGTFRPETAYFRGVTMADGSTLDLSAWTAGWPVASACTGSGNKTVRFASGATVTIDMGGQNAGKILEWDSADAEIVDTLTFNIMNGVTSAATVEKRSDGLYVHSGRGFIISVR